MNFNPTMTLRLVLVSASFLSMLPSSGAAEPVKVASLSKAETSIAAGSRQEKYSFILFWKKNDTATKAMWQTLRDGLADRSERAIGVTVKVTDPAEATIVKRYGVSRAPMPLMLAVAPNGAVTASFAKRLDANRLDEALVTPTMTRCMLAMQNRKLVLLCVHGRKQSVPPQGVADFHAIPCYQKTTEIVHMQTSDPAETKFLGELEIPRNARGTTTVFMAPPGVMLGKYPANVTSAQLIAKLKAAGQGCNDKNCKHCKP